MSFTELCSRPKYTITSGLTTTILSRIFRIKVNFTAFRTISGIFESTSGFRLLLPVHRFRFVASVFLIGSISSRMSAMRQLYGPEYGKKGRPPGDRGRTGSRNMATCKNTTTKSYSLNSSTRRPTLIRTTVL